jgi:tape measure domain-containing protein
VVLTLEEMEIFLGVTDNLQSAYQRVDQFATKTEARFKGVQATMDRAMGKDLLLTYKVNDAALTEANKHVESKRTHVKEVQQWLNQNPLSYKTDLSGIKAARAEVLGLQSDMRSLNSSLNQQGRITVESSIDASKFIQKFEQAGDKVAQKIESRVASERSRSTAENGTFTRNMERILKDANKQGLVGRIGAVITAPARAIAGSVGDVFRGASFSIGEAAIKPIEARIAAQLAPITQFIATRAGNVVDNASKFVQQRSGLTPDEAIRSFDAVGRKIDNIFDARKIYDSIKSGIGYLGELEYKTKGDRGSIPSVLGNSLKDKAINNPFVQNVILNNDIQKTSDYISTLDKDLINLNRVFLTTLGIVPDLVREFTFFGAIQKTVAKRDSLSYQLDPNRPSVAFSGGFGDMGRHGDYHAAQYKAGNLGSNVISVRNSITDGPGDKGFVYTALSKILAAVGVENKGQIGLTAILEHLSKNALGGINDDEINLAANALYAENLTSKSEIIAYCGGNLIAKGAAEIIDKGFPDSKVQAKGFAFGTPDVVRPSNPRYSSIISTADPAYAYSSLFGAKFASVNQGNEVKQGFHGITNYTTNPQSSAFLGTNPTLSNKEMLRGTFAKGDKSPTQELAHFQRAISEGQDHLESATNFLKAVSKTYQGIEAKISSGKSINDLESVIHSIYQNVRVGLDQLSEGLITANQASDLFRKNVFTIHTDLGSVSQNFGATPYAKPALDLSVPFEPTTTKKVLELATNTVEKVNQGLSALAPVGEAATNVLNDVARGLTNIADGQVQKRVDQLRGNDSSSGLAVQGDTSQRGTMAEFGRIAAQDIETTKQAALRATEQFVKFADGTIKAGKAARDFFQGLRSQGRTIQDLGNAVVEVSAELVSEFEGLGGTGAADIKLLTGAMAALKGEIDSLPPLLPAAGQTGLNEAEDKTQVLVQTAYSLYEVWDRLSKQSGAISLAQGGVFDLNSLEKSLNIIGQIELELDKARKISGIKYAPEYEGLISQVRSVQAPLGRLKAGAYSGLKKNLSQVKDAADAGDDTAQGFIDGFALKADVIASVANKAGKDLISELKAILGIASPSKVFIEIGKDVVAGFEIGLENLDDVFRHSLDALQKAVDTGKIKDFSLGDAQKLSGSIKAQVQSGNQNIRVNQFGTLLEDEKPKVQKTSREIGFEIGAKTKEGIDQASPGVKRAIANLSDGIINQLRIVAPGITGFIEGIGLDLNKLKSLGGAGLTLGAVAIGVGLFGGKILEVANNTADAATEQNRFKRVLDQTVAGGGAAYYGKLAAEANKYGVNLQAAAKSAVALETSLVNRPLAGQGVQILSGFEAQFAAQGTPVQDQERALVGVEQAIRKGKLQAEELYQIIEPLPGAMEALAAATGKTTAELFRATSQGEVFTEDIIQQFSNQLKIQSGLTGGADTAEASMGRLANQTQLLSANVGQVTVAARKIGTDLFGGALSIANDNAEILNTTFQALVITTGVGLYQSLSAAIPQIYAFATSTGVGAAGITAFNTGLAAMVSLALPVIGVLAAIKVAQFAWDLSQPSEDVKKLSDDLNKLLRKAEELDNKKLKIDFEPPTNLLEWIGAIGSGDVLEKNISDISSGRLKKVAQNNNDASEFESQVQAGEKLNKKALDYLSTLKSQGTELGKIVMLNTVIDDLNTKLSEATYSGNVEQATKLRKEIAERQEQLRNSSIAPKINENTSDLQFQISAYNHAISSAKEKLKEDPTQQIKIDVFERLRDNAQETLSLYGKISKLDFTNLQSVNSRIEDSLLQSSAELARYKRELAKAQATTQAKFGGPGANDQSQLAVAQASLKSQELKAAGLTLAHNINQLDTELKALKNVDLQSVSDQLERKGTDLFKATNEQLDQALKVLESGDRKPSESTKNAIAKFKQRNDFVDQNLANANEQEQAASAAKKAAIDLNNSIVEYNRQVRDSDYELKKSIEDNQRQLKRQFEDTIQETKQLFSDLAKIKLRNDLNSKIQTISGDFSDTVLSSLQSYFDKIAEVMDAKLTAAGIKTGLDRKLEDLGLGQRDFQRGVFNQQQGINDAAAGQSGDAKVYTPISGDAPPFLKKAAAVAQKIGVPLLDLLGIMNFETGGVLASQGPEAASKVTNQIGATGLIQFMPETARGLGTSTSSLRASGAMAQLDYVLKYFSEFDPSKYKKGLPNLYAAVLAGDPTDLYSRDSNGTNALSGAAEISKYHIPAVTKAFAQYIGQSQQSSAPPSIPSGTKFLLPLDHLPSGYTLPDQAGDNVYGAEKRERNFTTPFAESLKKVLEQAGFTAKVLKPESFGSYAEYDRALKRESQGAQTIAIHTLFDKYLGRENFVRIRDQNAADSGLGAKVAIALKSLGRGFGGFDTESNQTINLTGKNPGVLVELGIIKTLESKFNPDQAAKIFGAKLIEQFGGSLKPGNRLAVPSLPGQSDGTLPPAPDVAGAINEQYPLQDKLSAEKQRGTQIDAAKIYRDLKNQIETKTFDLFSAQIGLQAGSKQRGFDLLPQTPIIGVLSQLNSKQSADAQAQIKLVADAASLQRDIDKFKQIIELSKGKGLDTREMEAFRKQAILNKAAIDEQNKAIANTNPIKVFTRDLQIATEAQLGQADAMATQLDAINALLNASGTAPSGGAARAVEAQFRAARQGLATYNAETEATLSELDAKAKDFDASGDTGRATATRDAAKTLQAASEEFNYSGFALTDGAKAITVANAKLDEAFKKSLELRKPRDQFDAASQGLADKQASLLESSGDSFGANAIKRDLQVMKERKTLSDEIAANELEINKQTNLGTPESLNKADQIFATNDALKAQIELLGQIADVTFPSVARSLKLSIADAGSQAFGTLAKAIVDGNVNIQTLSDIFKRAGQSIIQTVIEIGQQFIKSQILNLLGGIFKPAGSSGIGSVGGGFDFGSLLGGIGGSLFGGGGATGFGFTPIAGFSVGGYVPNYANGEGYTLPAISAALDRERAQSGGLEPRLVVANTKERILNPKETMLWETIAKYGFRNENYAMGGSPSGGSVDGSSLSVRNSSSNSFGDFVFNGGGAMTPEEATALRKDVAGFVDKRIQDTEIQRRRSGR